MFEHNEGAIFGVVLGGLAGVGIGLCAVCIIIRRCRRHEEIRVACEDGAATPPPNAAMLVAPIDVVVAPPRSALVMALQQQRQRPAVFDNPDRIMISATSMTDVLQQVRENEAGANRQGS